MDVQKNYLCMHKTETTNSNHDAKGCTESRDNARGIYDVESKIKNDARWKEKKFEQRTTVKHH